MGATSHPVHAVGGGFGRHRGDTITATLIGGGGLVSDDLVMVAELLRRRSRIDAQIT